MCSNSLRLLDTGDTSLTNYAGIVAYLSVIGMTTTVVTELISMALGPRLRGEDNGDDR